VHLTLHIGKLTFIYFIFLKVCRSVGRSVCSNSYTHIRAISFVRNHLSTRNKFFLIHHTSIYTRPPIGQFHPHTNTQTNTVYTNTLFLQQPNHFYISIAGCAAPYISTFRLFFSPVILRVSHALYTRLILLRRAVALILLSSPLWAKTTMTPPTFPIGSPRYPPARAPTSIP